MKLQATLMLLALFASNAVGQLEQDTRSLRKNMKKKGGSGMKKMTSPKPVAMKKKNMKKNMKKL